MEGSGEGLALGWLKRVSHFSLEKGAFFHSLRVCNSRFHDLLREEPLSLFMLPGWSSLDLCCFLDDAFHECESHGQDPGVLKLDSMTHVYAVLSHG
jgi:hypothetical protein